MTSMVASASKTGNASQRLFQLPRRQPLLHAEIGKYNDPLRVEHNHGLHTVFKDEVIICIMKIVILIELSKPSGPFHLSHLSQSTSTTSLPERQ